MSFGKIVLWAVLGLSLFANAVVLGLVLRFGGMGGSETSLRSVWSSVPADTRAEFRAALAANRGEFGALVANLRDARAVMLTAAAARPYDRGAVIAAQASLRAATAAVQVRTHELMLAIFDTAAGADPKASP